MRWASFGACAGGGGAVRFDEMSQELSEILSSGAGETLPSAGAGETAP